MKSISIVASIISIMIAGCGGGLENGPSSSVSSCTNITNPMYHINYFENCGNAEQPVSKGTESSVTVWVEMDSPNTSSGKLWVDDIYLERSDMPGVNLTANSSFENGLYEHRENAMCLSTDIACRNIVETIDSRIWSLDATTYRSGRYSAAADITPLGQGFQTHIFAPLIPISGIRSGVTFKASAYVKVEGNVQIRVGIDFRDSTGAIRAVNGLILRGNTNGNWVNLSVR